MRKTILTCDRCKQEVSELVEVGAGKRDFNYSSLGGGGAYKVYQLWAEWCPNCCIETGIAKPTQKAEATPITPKPTLEDIIREIVQEELSQNQYQ